MSENDLSDEAFRQFCHSEFTKGNKCVAIVPLLGGLEVWQEAVRRAKANPWQLFDDTTLRELRSAPTTADNIYAIDAEMKRRQKPSELGELSECPNCKGSVWNEIPNGYQCDECGYLDV